MLIFKISLSSIASCLTFVECCKCCLKFCLSTLHTYLVIFCYFQTINICRDCLIIHLHSLTHMHTIIYFTHSKLQQQTFFYCYCLNSSNKQINLKKEKEHKRRKKKTTQLRHNNYNKRITISNTRQSVFFYSQLLVLYMAI